jgi:2-keto-4-pentenoate hydratase
MKIATRIACWCCLLAVVAGPARAWSTMENWADVLLLQIKAKQPLPALSAYGAGLSLAESYEVQRILVRELSALSPVVGFKAELTTPLAQVKMRGNGPVTTAVFKDDLLAPDADVGPAGAGEHSIAPAIGFIMKRRIFAPIADAAELPAFVAKAVPVVMVLDHRFENRAAVRAEDLVAANGAHTHLIVGKPFPRPEPTIVDSVFIETLHEGNVIDRAKATNVKGSQAYALRWLINQLVSQGLVIVPGQILVTGPLAEPLPISPGTYTVDFWEHQKIAVNLRAPGG